MRIWNGNKVPSTGSVRRTRRGFTLVELIVVLTILAILAAIGVGSAVGYIKKSKFDRNSENAISVYQVAQTAFSQKQSNGTMDSWVRSLIADTELTDITDFTAEQLNALDETDESVTKIVSLTYCPGSSAKASQTLNSLLAPYFYDQSVFGGTLSVEFVMSATYGADRVNYSATVVSAFYSLQNDPNENPGGWDNKCLGSSTDGLPERTDTYRFMTSYVGFYNGTEASVKPQITSVFLPMSVQYGLDGHIIAGSDETGLLFNLRNGETLDACWSFFDEDGQSYEDHDENIEIRFSCVEANGNASTTADVVLYITDAELDAFRQSVTSQDPVVTHEQVNGTDITRDTRSGVITIHKITYLKSDGTSKTNNNANFVFPITISRVSGDGRTGCPVTANGNPADYYEYRLSIDCMMIRSEEYGGNYTSQRYNSERLFGYDRINNYDYTTPRNIYATIRGSYTYHVAAGGTTDKTFGYDTSAPIYAARAIDDPVYFTGIKVVRGNTTYAYTLPDETSGTPAAYDGNTTTSDGKTITGICVVNTLFGDLKYSNSVSLDPDQTITIEGTSWSSSGGDAVITSFRHLYNIRKIKSGTTATYRIVRELNWYVHRSGLALTSEVRVYNWNGEFNSPAVYGDSDIHVVSFPAIPYLYSGQTLTSMSREGGRLYSINNVQMRTASFQSGVTSYGLVCQNKGQIYNIYTENLSLILANVTDGNLCDYSGSSDKVSPSGNISITNNGSKILGNGGKNVGGLIGLNEGIIGQNGLSDDINTICMVNPLVMAGEYWQLANYSAGGIIGRIEGTNVQSYGVLRVRGRFIVVTGGNDAGGAIGALVTSLGSRIVVDGNSWNGHTPEYDLPTISHTGQKPSCIVSGFGQVGGAIGYMGSYAFTNVTAYSDSRITTDSVTGMQTFNDSGVTYQLDVTLPIDSLILKMLNNDDCPVGGAIGRWNGSTGVVNIRVNNDGLIVANDDSKNTASGGAIGSDDNGSVSAYINIVNGQNSRIGNASTNVRGPVRSGGAIGFINGNVADRSIFINASNDGEIRSRGNGDRQGSGGAIGGCSDDTHIYFRINVINRSNSLIIDSNTNNDNSYGTGGAIGGMGNAKANGSNSYLPVNSVISVQNSGTISGQEHVGGAIGNAPKNLGSIYVVNQGTISGEYYVGGAVGRLNYNHEGKIQSILDGATISGTNFVGGAAGSLLSLRDNASVKTIVRGSSSVTGTTLVGGVCGDVQVQDTGTGCDVSLSGDASSPVLTITGSGDGVGGVAGLMRFTVQNSCSVGMPDQSSTDKLVLRVDGKNYVGGAIGALRSTSAGYNNSPSAILSAAATSNNVLIDLRVVLHPESHIVGTGDDVGGAIGFMDTNGSKFGGYISVSSSSGSSAGQSYIRGNRYVGGAVGYFKNTLPSVFEGVTAGISVNFSLAPWTIEATVAANSDANVGGAVGYFDGNYGSNGNMFPIDVNLGTTTVKALGPNVGGAVGKSSMRLGIIHVTNLAGLVEGQYNIGGAIGLNQYSFNEATVNVLSGGKIRATGSYGGSGKDAGSNAGGVVGSYSFSANDSATITSNISATISGTVFGTGNNVGGAVGYCYSNKKTHLIRDISVTLQGEAVIQGVDNVGGVNGFSQSNITNVSSNISGNSKVIGNNRVGGAIGWTYANDQAAGLEVLYESKDITGYSLSQLESALSRGLYKHSGRIYSITATISADYALQGDMYLGGAVGQSGFKSLEGGNKYSSPALVNVEAVINAGFLFDPFNTGNTGGDACVGGVIGLVVDGRINDVRLSGTGGTVVTDSRYQCPEISMNGAVLIAGYGRSIGGIIGQIGLEGWNSSTGKYIYTGNNAQNVTVSSISASSSLKICVVSMDGSDRIGGWIGSAYGKFGGIGNRASSDYTNVNTRATYEVNNVRYVYSRGDCVGGFCGLSQAFGTSRETYVIVNVTLTDATVTGRSCVGGAFGKVYGVYFKKGSINVSLNSHTVIGDVNGSTLCYEAGGAIGDLLLNSAGESQTVKLEIPITVSIDNTSHIWAAGGNDDSYTSYGVGGVLGRAYGEFNTAGTIHVSSTDPESVAVYSRYSNVGGAIGLMEKVKMHSYNSNNVSYAENLTVRAEGTNASAGGFAGRIISLEDKMLYCYYRGTGTVISTGSNSDAGGFAGFAYLNGKTLENCYTTAEVNSSGVYTGGFIGNVSYGTINNSYVGGRTYNGAYVAGSGNITGVGNVGGFIGATTGNNTVTINNCYSTASVLGTADNIGGFIGNSSSTTVIKSSYCTGRVNGTYTTTTDDDGNTVYHYPTTGTFAGLVQASNLNNITDNKVMRLINPVGYPLIGENWTSSIGTGNVDYADASAIKGNNNHTGHPYDTAALGSVFGLRAVIGNEHYGDWPLPVTEASIENATVLIYTKIGDDAEGEPVYDWIDFVNGQYETVFNGTAVTLDDILKVQVQGENLERDVDYTLSYRSNSKIGTATVIISAKPGNPNGYSGALSRTFRITGADIEGSTITLNEHSREYTGARIEPDVTVVYHGTTLQLNTDYRLAYDRDGDIEQGFDSDNISIGEMYVYVVGINNYEGVKVCDQKFRITAIDLSNLDPDDPDDITLVGADSLVYDEDDAGDPVAHCPGVVVRYGGNTLNGTTDPDATGYDYVISYRNNTQAGTAYLIITGTADESIGTGSVYTGTCEVEFTINQAVNTWVTQPILYGWTYGSGPNAPEGKAKYGDFVCEFYSDINCGADTLISDISNADAGTYYAKIYVPESVNYQATTPEVVRVTIDPAPITDAVVTIDDPSQSQFDYDGESHTPDPSTVTVTLNGEPLDYSTDYTITNPDDSTSAGMKTLTVTGCGNYTGTATGTYEIVLKHSVTFNMNGHGDAIDPQSIVDGSFATQPEVSVIQSYAFRGWYTDSSCQTLYDFNTPVTEDIVLYAKWVNVVTVTFFTNAEGIEVPSVIIDRGTTTTLPELTRDGFVFEGWYSDSNFTPSSQCTSNTYFNKDTTLFAKWIKLCTVSFDTNGGSSVESPQTVQEGQMATEPAAAPTRDGYTFDGWYTERDGGTVFDFSVPITEDVTIYAKWEEA